jgi:hypothetical protein
VRRRTRIATVAGMVAATAAVGLTVAALAAPVHSQPDVIMARGTDHLPSQTATDWTSYADQVVVVTAAAQQSVPPTQQELARGEGVIGRTVTLKIDKVLWSRDDAPKPAPATWHYSAFGWQFKD